MSKIVTVFIWILLGAVTVSTIGCGSGLERSTAAPTAATPSAVTPVAPVVASTPPVTTPPTSTPPPPLAPATLISLMIEPRNSVLASGEQYPFSALGQYSDGHTQDVTQQVSWATSSTMSATVDNGATNTHGTVTAGSVPATVTVSGSIGAISDQTPLTVTLFNHIPASPAQGDTPFKEVDFVAIESLYYSGYPDRDAASQLFTGVFRPYYFAAGNTASQATILNRVKFSCAENLADPTTPGNTLAFPFDLDPARKKAILWHRYNCTFALNYTDTTGTAVSYTSGIYKINQLDIDYNQYPLESGTAFENYNFGSSTEPDYHYLGRYVQPLDKMLRQRDDSVPLEFLAGVNGGYDYRVDAWSSSTSDNICPPRSSPVDRNSFYSHPAPAQCQFGSDALPGCAVDNQLPYTDDLGDSLVLLPAAQQIKSYRNEPFQSFNCGGLQESFDRGAVAFYPGDIATFRTSANRGDLAELLNKGEKPVSATGCGPLLIQAAHFVYDQDNSEEGMPIDNYEISPTVGIGYEHRADGGVTAHLVNVEGHDNTVGFHDWMLGLYFLSPYAHSEGANTLGNGGDATLWIHPHTAAVEAVLADPTNSNYAYFKAVFVDNNNPGITSNCDFSSRPIGCNARPVHDGIFVKSPVTATSASLNEHSKSGGTTGGSTTGSAGGGSPTTTGGGTGAASPGRPSAVAPVSPTTTAGPQSADGTARLGGGSMGLSSAVVLSAAATVRHGLLKAEDRDNEENIAKKLVDDRSAH